ncbi:MAG: hypothetical protein N3G21_12635 [Candidatus Hydrogenedentes bacterium]|nr:hypothetical protein [Candidatus Hydrogenedentota bacterium]
MVAVSEVRAKFGWTEAEVSNSAILAGIETAEILVRACLAEEFKHATGIEAITEGEIMLVGALTLRLHTVKRMPELADADGESENSSASARNAIELILKVADMLEKEGWRLIAPYCRGSASSGSIIRTTESGV